MRIPTIIFLAALAACNNTANRIGPVKDSSFSKNDSDKTNDQAVTTDFTNDSLITISFPTGANSITVTGKITSINQPVSVIVPVTTGSNLTVLLVPEDSIANVRINQIFTPDGKADGPFGRLMTRKITQWGDYKLVIGENLMQGEEWKGKFRLTVKIE